jgi:hypothetical protein
MSKTNGADATLDDDGCREVTVQHGDGAVSVYLSRETAVTSGGACERIKARLSVGPMDLSFRMQKQTAERLGETLVALADD